MSNYLLSVVQPFAEGTPPPDNIDEIMADLEALNAEMKAAGAWVFSNGLHPASTATVVRPKDGELLTTDGPYLEGKEHIGGLFVIDAPDLDAALRWADRIAQATTLPVEVRPFQ